MGGLQLPKLRVASACHSLKNIFVIVSATIRNLTSSWTWESHSSRTTCRHTLTHSRKMAYPSSLQNGKQRKRRTHGIPSFSSRKLHITWLSLQALVNQPWPQRLCQSLSNA